MTELSDIVLFLDTYLEKDCVQDDSWNGLQVEGKEQVNKIVFAVDAGMETFERALEEKADMIVVHHGMFWKSSNPSISRWNKKRVKFLLDHKISLYASHLPLDKHPEVGNNAQLIKMLGFERADGFGLYEEQQIGFIGRSKKAKLLSEIESDLEAKLGATCKTLPFGNKEISSIAIVSGGGANFGLFFEAVAADVGLYVTGDSTEMYQMAKDVGMNVIFAGHHATETVGLIALSEVVKSKFVIETAFVDIPTGL